MPPRAVVALLLWTACTGAPRASDAVGSVPAPELIPGVWRTLVPGLDVAEFKAHDASSIGDSMIRVVRVDPTKLEVVLFGTTLEDGSTRTAREWADRHGLVAATNPGMFHPDLRSTGYMRVGDDTVNGARNGDRSMLVAGAKEEGLPPLRLLDAQCDDLDAVADHYRYAVQSIRMLSCSGQNVWSSQPKKWSHAVVGTDEAGRLLLVHARSPWNTHDFIEQVRSLPLDLDRLMYGEGGPEAQLFVRAGGFEGEWIGSYETGFYERDTNRQAWPVPNVIGVRAR